MPGELGAGATAGTAGAGLACAALGSHRFGRPVTREKYAFTVSIACQVYRVPVTTRGLVGTHARQPCLHAVVLGEQGSKLVVTRMCTINAGSIVELASSQRPPRRVAINKRCLCAGCRRWTAYHTLQIVQYLYRDVFCGCSLILRVSGK